jgi:hypothetical protein
LFYHLSSFLPPVGIVSTVLPSPEKPAVEDNPQSYNQDGPSQETVMHAISLFLDGASRGLIASFGPSLVYRLVYGETVKLGIDCAKVAIPLATLSAAYLLGRGLGNRLAPLLQIEDEKKPRIVARLAGAAIALLVFTFGAGLQSVW